MSTAIERPATYRDYSPDFKAEVLAALDANKGNQTFTASQFGINESTLREWIKQADRYRDYRAKKQAELAERAQSAAHYYLDLALEKAPEANFGQLMTGFGIAVDKRQLLLGQPTSIIEHIERPELVSILQEALESQLDVIDVDPEP